ncbi:pleckstrin homology domain-containing family J member 1-like isoform X2 [Diadema setosum]|uniref:pleckstrin homology domain-containing family J member 1-like isoform X2 n=1 Tax=Diadema setosum TaxID=31175 RepID=UPI003B3B9211
MRYSDQELMTLACSTPTFEARLFYKQVSKRRREGYRERLFRQKSNFLFYFRIHESSRTLEPIGALLLERCTIQEEAMDGGRYVFSLTYQDESERKHFFATYSPLDYKKWIDLIKTSSYERLKSTFLILQRELIRVKDVERHKNASPKPVRPAPKPPSHPPVSKAQLLSPEAAENRPQESSEKARKDEKGEGVLIDIA